MLKHRWKVHLIWFAVVLSGGTASFYGGAYCTGWALTQLMWQNERGDSFGQVSGEIRMLTRNDLAFYHQFATGRLRDAVIHLSFEDGDWRCSDNQRRTLSHAGRWFQEHPDRDPIYAPLQDVVAEGLRACDRP
jgi:hypothetical protein